jgi:circadian clock protein KaiC
MPSPDPPPEAARCLFLPRDYAMSVHQPAATLPKISTGVPGLDEVLRGGYAIGRPTLISGGPGSGKTNLALSLVVSACDRGEPVVFVAFEENPEALRRNAGTLGHDLAALEACGALAIVDAGMPPHTEVLGRFSLEGLQAILANKLRELKAQTMILDGLDALTQLMGDPPAERQQLYELHRWILENKITTLMTAKYNRDSIIPHLYDDFLNYLADCIINLENMRARPESC